MSVNGTYPPLSMLKKLPLPQLQPLQTMRWCSAVFVVSFLVGSIKGDPILGPDFASCRPFQLPHRVEGETVSCCFKDDGKPIRDFKFPTELPMRVRRPVHILDEEFVRQYEKAYALMRALPADDPRSLVAQTKTHCAYTSQVYAQYNASQMYTSHFNWFCMPFHRIFLYFHERILASLLGDDSFAVPYWAWDIQTGLSSPSNVYPPIFDNPTSPLYDVYRSHMHRPPQRANLEIEAEMINRDPDYLLRNNYYQLWRTMKGEVKSAQAFYGFPVRRGDEPKIIGGPFELGPHSGVHAWMADEFTPAGEDMAQPWSAARDPIFFAHHSQMDRLWLMWKSFGGKDLDDPDWLDAEFVFYDENAERVRVKLRDSLDMEKLRIQYEMIPVDWMDYSPRSIRDGSDARFPLVGLLDKLWRRALDGMPGRVGALFENSILRLENMDGIILGGGSKRSPMTIRVPRADKQIMNAAAEKEGDDAGDTAEFDEILVVGGVVTKPYNTVVVFDVFVELPEADEVTPHDCVESLGRFFFDLDGKPKGDTLVTTKFSRTIGMSERLKILGLEDVKSLAVTFVLARTLQHDAHDAHVAVELNELNMKFVKV